MVLKRNGNGADDSLPSESREFNVQLEIGRLFRAYDHDEPAIMPQREFVSTMNANGTEIALCLRFIIIN
jgi:hypothetical protein